MLVRILSFIKLGCTQSPSTGWCPRLNKVALFLRVFPADSSNEQSVLLSLHGKPCGIFSLRELFLFHLKASPRRTGWGVLSEDRNKCGERLLEICGVLRHLPFLPSEDLLFLSTFIEASSGAVSFVSSTVVVGSTYSPGPATHAIQRGRTSPAGAAAELAGEDEKEDA